MKFKNNGKETQIRIKEENGYRWQIVKENEIVEFPEKINLPKEFEIFVEETKAKTKKSKFSLRKK